MDFLPNPALHKVDLATRVCGMANFGGLAARFPRAKLWPPASAAKTREDSLAELRSDKPIDVLGQDRKTPRGQSSERLSVGT
jgi:hypothetical protein